MIRLCLFDMDGLLIDSERQMWMPSQAKACKEQGYILTDELHYKYMGMNLTDALSIVGEALPGIDVNKMFDRTLEINNSYIEKGIPLMKGAKELIDYLKANNIKICICTSTPRKQAIRTLDIIGIKDDFDAIVCGNEVTHGKPAPDIYLKGFEKFDCNKDEVLVFEDGEAGGKAALAAGFRLILVPDLAYIKEDTKEKAYKIINHLDDAIDIIKEENERTSSI